MIAQILSEDWKNFLNPLVGPMLGAAFYILIKTQPYLLNRTFDPKYNAAYWSRFVTGTISGIILSVGLGQWINAKMGTANDAAFTPTILGILGGYATEVVEQILERLSTVLLVAIRGDDSSQKKTKQPK